MHTINCSSEDHDLDKTLKVQEELLEEEVKPEDGFQVINFTVKSPEGLSCFSCAHKLEIEIPYDNASSFESVLSFNNTSKGTKFLEDNKNCVNCNTQLFYIYSNPVAIPNTILDEDVMVRVDERFVKDMEQKIIELANIYKLMAIHRQPENAVGVIHEYPHYFFFKILEINHEHYLSLNCYKKHLVGEETLKSVRKNATELYTHMINSTPGKPTFSTKKYSECLGTSFYDIDETYKEYKSLLFLDIDGTISKKSLEGCSGSLSTTLFRFLSALEKSKFVKVVLNTGRPTIWGMLYMKDLGLDPLVIGNNGTGICYKKKSVDLTKSSLVLSNAPTTGSMSYVLDVLSAKYGLKFGVLTKSNTSCGQIIVSNIGIPDPKYLQKLINQDPELMAFLDQVGLGKLTCTDDGGGFVNIRSNKYNKAKTGLKLINAIGMPLSHCFNIGNAENDICLVDLLKENSYGVANSDSIYAEKVPNISEHKEARGVVQIIKKFLVMKQICTLEELDTIVDSVIQQVKKENQFLFK